MASYRTPTPNYGSAISALLRRRNVNLQPRRIPQRNLTARQNQFQGLQNRPGNFQRRNFQQSVNDYQDSFPRNPVFQQLVQRRNQAMAQHPNNFGQGDHLQQAFLEQHQQADNVPAGGQNRIYRRFNAVRALSKGYHPGVDGNPMVKEYRGLTDAQLLKKRQALHARVLSLFHQDKPSPTARQSQALNRYKPLR